MYPEELWSSDFYSGIESALTYAIRNYRSDCTVEKNFNLIKSEFSGKAYEDYNTDEERRNMLTVQVAGIYKVCIENEDIQNFIKEQHEDNFTDHGFLADKIQECLAEVTDTQLAGEIFYIFEKNIN